MKVCRKTVSSVATLFLIGSALVAGDIRVDGLVESTGLGFKFPNGSVQTSAANQYDKVLIVAKSGAPFTTIQAAIDSVTDAPGNRYLVWVGPGVYNERVTMKAGVDIQGSGALTTRITFGGSQSPDIGRPLQKHRAHRVPGHGSYRSAPWPSTKCLREHTASRTNWTAPALDR